ncbi:MAG: acyl-CoA dehydrogenase family protein [Pseudomonadota bacterium]
MDISLNAEQRAWQHKAREFAQDEIRPISLKQDQISDPKAAFDWDIIRKGSKLGFRTAVVPRDAGGHGIDAITQVLVMKELARGDSAIAKTFSQCWKWSHLIASHCSADQRNRFLPAFLEDDTYLLGHAGTEPNAGSDHRLPPEDDPKSGWQLKAERHGEEWLLNGEKCFMANGGVAKLFFVSTRTNPNVRIQDGGTEFLVPIDTPGLRVGTTFNKSGWRFYQNGQLIFENARVPHENVVGEVNEGYKTRGGGFGDLELSANALGVCEDAIELATAHAKSRWPNARYVLDNQTVQLQLSEMHMLTEALRSFVMRMAAETDAGQHTTSGVLLMNFATDVIQRVTRLNLDLHAGAGAQSMPARVDKLARDAVIWTHLAGDSVQRMKVVRRMAWN